MRFEQCKGGQLRDLTLTRAEGQMDTAVEGVLIRQCSETVLENVRVIDNRTIASAIGVRESQRHAAPRLPGGELQADQHR